VTTGLGAFADWKSAIEARLAFQLDQAQARMVAQTADQGQAVPGAQAALARLLQAMRHGVLNGGKRARGLLLMAGAQAGGADPMQEAVLDAACAVEFVHAFSLVHDDMPCMDDDDLRRGQPTVHVAYDEPTALLVGDALQTLAFECLAVSPGPADRQLRLIRCLAQATGALGMAGGQAVDMAAVGQTPEQRELEAMHRLKTGALIVASVEMGGLLAPEASQSPDFLNQLVVYAKNLGLAFQVVDDLLDASADTQTLGKTAGKDQAQGKPTFVSLMGHDRASDYAAQLLQRALDPLSGYGHSADALRGLAQALTHRAY
jgi:farnesyl diphosphate synthase